MLKRGTSPSKSHEVLPWSGSTAHSRKQYADTGIIWAPEGITEGGGYGERSLAYFEREAIGASDIL
jgi:hypothetical protein